MKENFLELWSDPNRHILIFDESKKPKDGGGEYVLFGIVPTPLSSLIGVRYSIDFNI